MTLRHGGRVLVDQLVAQGVDAVFCVPGESYLAALDGLYDRREVRTFACRQEGGAAMMAEASGKMTGRPGVCFVTRGPGATNASAGLHVARQDSTPMVLFVGQVQRSFADREAFQEIDHRRMFGELAKWVAQIDDAKRIPEYVSRAFSTACSGRPGPVVLALPEDVLGETVEVTDALPVRPAEARATRFDMDAFTSLLAGSKRPLLVVGGSGWSSEIAQAVGEFAQRLDLPVCAEFRCQDYLDNRLDCYVGDLGLAPDLKLKQRVRESDLLILIGARLGQLASSRYTLLEIPNPRQRLVHVYPDPDELGRLYRPDLAICASSRSFADQLSAVDLRTRAGWRDWSGDARADYLLRLAEPESPDGEGPARVSLESVVCWLREELPPDAIVTNGAGLYTATLQRYFQYSTFPSQLAPRSGSMGYGLPAAIAARVCRPEAPIVCFAGDGCFLMTGQELATAMQYELKIIVVVANNSSYGTIRHHQERQYPGRPVATSLRNPDFVAYARSFGAEGELVTETEQFAGAFARAMASDKSVLIELRMAPLD